MALSHGAKQALWFRYITCDIRIYNGEEPPVTELYSDNTAVIAIASSMAEVDTSKHNTTLCANLSRTEPSISHMSQQMICLSTDSSLARRMNSGRQGLHYLRSEGVCWRTAHRYYITYLSLTTFTTFPFLDIRGVATCTAHLFAFPPVSCTLDWR